VSLNLALTQCRLSSGTCFESITYLLSCTRKYVSIYLLWKK